MKLNPGSRVRLILKNLVTTFDPIDSVIDFTIDDDGEWHTATFVGTPKRNYSTRWRSQSKTQWKSEAQSDEWFAGPEGAGDGAVVLDPGTHSVEIRLTTGVEVIQFKTDDIVVAD